MSLPPHAILVSGFFRGVRILSYESGVFGDLSREATTSSSVGSNTRSEHVLSEYSRFGFHAVKHNRSVRVDFPGDERMCYACGEYEQSTPFDPHVVQIYDILTQCPLVNIVDAPSHLGLDSVAGGSILDSRAVVVGSRNNEIKAYDAESGECVSHAHRPPNRCYCITHCYEWSREEIYVGGGGGFCGSYNLERDTIPLVTRYNGHPYLGNGVGAQVRDLYCDWRRNLLISVSPGSKSVKFWDRNSGEEEAVSLDIRSPAYSLFYVDDLNCLMVGSRHCVELWDSRMNSTCIRRIPLEPDLWIIGIDRISTYEFVSGSSMSYVSVWDVSKSEGKELNAKVGRLCGRVMTTHVLGDVETEMASNHLFDVERDFERAMARFREELRLADLDNTLEKSWVTWVEFGDLHLSELKALGERIRQLPPLDLSLRASNFDLVMRHVMQPTHRHQVGVNLSAAIYLIDRLAISEEESLSLNKMYGGGRLGEYLSLIECARCFLEVNGTEFLRTRSWIVHNILKACFLSEKVEDDSEEYLEQISRLKETRVVILKALSDPLVINSMDAMKKTAYSYMVFLRESELMDYVCSLGLLHDVLNEPVQHGRLVEIALLKPLAKEVDGPFPESSITLQEKITLANALLNHGSSLSSITLIGQASKNLEFGVRSFLGRCILGRTDLETIAPLLSSPLPGINLLFLRARWGPGNRVRMYSYLHHAVWNGDVERVELLMRLGADPNVLSSGRTMAIRPIHLAAWQKNWELVKRLVDAWGAFASRSFRSRNRRWVEMD